MIRYATVVSVLAIAVCNATWAIVGCLTEVEELVPRADHVVLARVTAVAKLKLTECQEGGAYWGQSNRCDGLFRFGVTVSEQIKGSTPQEISVVVGSDGSLVLDCDDRPPVGGMKGLTVLLFLETHRNRYWTLDGPNSIYAWPGRAGPRDEIITRVRSLLKAGN